MRHLDFTIDFETTGLTATAAPMQVAVVPWRRDNERDPFTVDDEGTETEEKVSAWPEPYVGYVDLRTCIVDGFDFDPATVRWWTEKSAAAKRAVTAGLPEPVTDVLVNVLEYIRSVVAQYQLESICLWCQGMDIDIALLRHLCKKYDIDLEDTVPHTSFRDCRTMILEAALVKREQEIAKSNEEYIRTGTLVTEVKVMGEIVVPCTLRPDQILADPSKAYTVFDPLPDEYARGSEAHDALYDATRSSWYTWQALKTLRQ